MTGWYKTRSRRPWTLRLLMVCSPGLSFFGTGKLAAGRLGGVEYATVKVTDLKDNVSRGLPVQRLPAAVDVLFGQGPGEGLQGRVHCLDANAQAIVKVVIDPLGRDDVGDHAEGHERYGEEREIQEGEADPEGHLFLFQHVADAADRLDEAGPAPCLELLAQVGNMDVDDVRVRSKPLLPPDGRQDLLAG